jgi:hypothetical protein
MNEHYGVLASKFEKINSGEVSMFFLFYFCQQIYIFQPKKCLSERRCLVYMGRGGENGSISILQQHEESGIIHQ